MKKETELKPWYKKWWGVIVCILFFPITLIFLVWKKTEWKSYVKVLTTMAILIVTFTAMASNSTSNAPSSNEPVFTPGKEAPKVEVNSEPVKEAETTPAPIPTATIAPTVTQTPVVEGATSSGVVKMSSSGICHAPGTTYYDRTTNYTPYNSIDACISAGGRLPLK